MLNWNFAEGFHPTSKVWLYQCSRLLSDTEATEMETALNNFAKEWTAHKQELKAMGKVLLNRFALLMVDESVNEASGCSIDASVKTMRELENKFSITLLDRSVLLFERKNFFFEIPLQLLKENISTGKILLDDFYFDNTITTLDQLKAFWRIPVNGSWIFSRHKINFDSAIQVSSMKV